MHEFTRSITIRVNSNRNGYPIYCSENCPHFVNTAYMQSCSLFHRRFDDRMRCGRCLGMFSVPCVEPEEGSDLWVINMAAKGHRLVSADGYIVHMNDDGDMVINSIYKYTQEDWLKKAPPVGKWKIKEGNDEQEE